MKKLIIILGIIILVGAATFFFTKKPSSPLPENQNAVLPPSSVVNPSPAPAASPQASNIDTNDNLDQALQDLESVK